VSDSIGLGSKGDIQTAPLSERRKQKLSREEASEYFWDMLIERLQ